MSPPSAGVTLEPQGSWLMSSTPSLSLLHSWIAALAQSPTVAIAPHIPSRSCAQAMARYTAVQQPSERVHSEPCFVCSNEQGCTGTSKVLCWNIRVPQHLCTKTHSCPFTPVTCHRYLYDFNTYYPLRSYVQQQRLPRPLYQHPPEVCVDLPDEHGVEHNPEHLVRQQAAPQSGTQAGCTLVSSGQRYPKPQPCP